jgi:hypothetical protein
MCQVNTEAFQDDINKTYGTNFNMPVVYYSQMMAVAYGKSAKEAGLDQQIIRATKLEEIAAIKPHLSSPTCIILRDPPFESAQWLTLVSPAPWQ